MIECSISLTFVSLCMCVCVRLISFFSVDARTMTKHDIYLNNKMEQKYGHSDIF